jgi:hypothetical protein
MIANDFGSDWVGMDRQIMLKRFEPDFIQAGDMTLVVRGKNYARGADIDTEFTFSPSEEYINIDEQRRQMRLRFASNVAGGDFQFGQNLCKVSIGDGNQ